MGIFDAGRSILESVASEASEQVVFAPVGAEPSVARRAALDVLFDR